MPAERITSRQNGRIKEIIRLTSSADARKETGAFVLEGARLCGDAAASGIEILLLCVSDSAAGRKEAGTLTAVAKETMTVPDSLFAQISETKSPQGLLCVAKTPSLWRKMMRPGGRYLALENISDPGNLGTIARTAEALGLDGLILSGGCDPFSPKVQRASMGSLLRLPLVKADSLPVFLKNQRLPSFAAVPAMDAADAGLEDFAGGGIICIGNEGNGLTAKTEKSCSRRITIPMAGRAESLNAAAAAAILCYLLTRG